ncbi:GSCFA domain-containing protein [Brevundimonas sp.]|uniref:GSCFA domain-containing protein n=1 Tax=Brevundimonas sp. TaxID=1871086 RepID=UPI003BA92F94
MKIATAGSCFAQHIGGHLRNANYQVMDVEPAPSLMSDSAAREFGWRIYSARYGNIYLAEQLLQVAREAFGLFTPADPVWEKGGRFYDAMRPSVEPQGLDSREEVLAHRAEHLASVRRLFETMDLFIFTFGLTEGWVHTQTGTTYPTAPGTIAGAFDPDIHSFKNFRGAEIRAAFLAFRDLIKAHNPEVKFLLTVSPVPLTATATDQHILAATTYSKSVLRAVAGELADDHADIDYFPSYEVIASPFSRGFFYSPNLRSVEAQGVLSVMRVFFDQHPPIEAVVAPRIKGKAKRKKLPSADDVVCEEAMLEAFS